KALLTIKGYGTEFGVTHDFSDPKAPSTRESVIMKPDAGAAGGLKVVRPAEVAPAAESFTIGD
ncbi:ABC transporter substrate-binding protein, partial [Streptomyces sp. SID7982]|nr:ABC transporter substrate-binding protein [Streptomyces sp. SID7982]